MASEMALPLRFSGVKAANSMMCPLPVAKYRSLFVTGGAPRITMNRDDPRMAAVLMPFIHFAEPSNRFRGFIFLPVPSNFSGGFMLLPVPSNRSCTFASRFFSTKMQKKSLHI